MAVFAAPVALGALVIEAAAAYGGIAGVGIIGGVVGYKISDSIKSEVW